jgi:hypothetical protein
MIKKAPHDAPGADGTIGLEWVDSANDRKIFMDIGPDWISIYARIGSTTLVKDRPS